MSDPNQTLRQATDEIRDHYTQHAWRPRGRRALTVLFQSQLSHYDALFRTLGLLPLGPRRILDVGCGNGGWLGLCCTRWGAQETNCVGADLCDDTLAAWRQQHPDSKITLLCRPAHELDFPHASFDLVHHSMMLSSVPSRPLRDRIAEVMWQLVRPGGYVLSYDFWTNPFNPRTVGMRRKELRRLFPQARWAFARTITLAPPLARLLIPLGARVLLGLERLRMLNTHYLVALAKDGP